MKTDKELASGVEERLLGERRICREPIAVAVKGSSRVAVPVAAQLPEPDLAPPNPPKADGAEAPVEPADEMFPEADSPMDPVQVSVSIMLLGIAVVIALVGALVHFSK